MPLDKKRRRCQEHTYPVRCTSTDEVARRLRTENRGTNPGHRAMIATVREPDPRQAALVRGTHGYLSHPPDYGLCWDFYFPRAEAEIGKKA